MREDIQGGLRNAMERGASLEKAIKSFMSAGYSEAEVREAAKIFSTPAIGVVNSPETTAFLKNAQKQVGPLPAKPPAQAAPQQQLQPKQIQSIKQDQVHDTLSGASGTNKTVIILIAVLTVLVGLFIASLLFKDQIATALKTALGK